MGNRAQQLRQAVQAAHPGATVVERTPNGITHQLGTTRILDVSVAPIHHHDGSDWVETDTTLDDLGGAQGHRGRTLPHGTTIGPSGIRRIEPRASHPLEWIEFKRIENPAPAPGQWNELGFEPQQVTDNQVHWIGSPAANPDYELTYKITPGGIKAIYTALNPDGATDVRWEYELQGLTVVGTTIVSDSDGEVVMHFQEASMVDANGEEFPVIQTIGSTYITLTPDYTGVTFPVEVDPTVDPTIDADADDGKINGSWTSGNNPVVGERIASANKAWFRFAVVSVPKDATINVAHLVLEHNTSSTGNVLTNIFCIAEDDHVAPLSGGDWDTDHTLHTSGVTWDFTTATSGSINSPSIVTPVQEIVDRAGWVSGQAIGVHHDDDGSSTDNFQWWQDFNDATPAVLHIEYSTATFDQEGYRWRKDDGSESAAGWHAAQDVDVTLPGETTTRVRVLVDTSGDTATSQMKLQFRKVGDADSEWEDVNA